LFFLDGLHQNFPSNACVNRGDLVCRVYQASSLSFRVLVMGLGWADTMRKPASSRSFTFSCYQSSKEGGGQPPANMSGEGVLPTLGEDDRSGA
jgi:hypothetical protein